MLVTNDSHALPRARFATRAGGLLLVLLYLHLRLQVNPALIYQAQRPVFLTDLGFFKSFLTRPGGLVEYASVFLSQFNSLAWAGALIITVTAGLICLGTFGLLRLMGTGRPSLAAYAIPAILLAIVYGRYQHDPAATGQILTSLALVNVYGRIPIGKALARLAIFIASSAAVYYLIGSGYVLFALLCGIVELIRNRSIFSGIFCLLCAAGVPYGFAAYSYDFTPIDVYGPLLPLSNRASPTLAPPVRASGWLHLALVLYFPLAAIWAGLPRQVALVGLTIRQRSTALWSVIRGRDGSSPGPEGVARPASLRRKQPVMFIIVGMLLATVGLDRGSRSAGQVRYAVANKMWEQALKFAASVPPEAYDMYVMRDVNTALYNTGRLPYEMFRYPQRYGMDTIFLTYGVVSGLSTDFGAVSQALYELGFMNEADRYANASLDIQGPSPEVLERLAKINILKGKPETARTYLGLLGRNLLCRRRAQEHLRRLEADPLMQDDQELNTVRARMIQTDYLLPGMGSKESIAPRLTQAMEQQISAGKPDKKVFEHLMAFYLLIKRLDKVVACMARQPYLDYPDIPRQYEEALLLYVNEHPKSQVELAGINISRDSRERFRDFLSTCTREVRQNPALHQDVLAKHSGSYFLYYTFGFSDYRWAKLSAKPAATTGATR